MYNLGTIGSGHWFRKLHEVLKKKKEIKLVKAVGTRSYEDKKFEMINYGISKSNYFQANGAVLPTKFFENVDIVYIASPNRFHKQQTVQSLENGKVVVTEKTFAANEKDFQDFVRFIKTNKFENKVTLNLHYLSKALTKELERRLPEFLEKYGKIKSVSATFFEKTNDEDARRKYLFSQDEGGIFLDWVHPTSIVSYILKAEKFKLQDANGFLVQPSYDSVNPTAVEARFSVSGKNFIKNANVMIRVGKGFDFEYKNFRINFKHTICDINYLSTKEEITTGKSGEIKILSREMQTIPVAGHLSYENLLSEMINMAEEKQPKLRLEDVQKIFAPVWQVNEKIWKAKVITSSEEINKFISTGR